MSTSSEAEPILDNYGFVNIACGGFPMNGTAGIRDYRTNGDGVGPMNQPPTQQPSIRQRLIENQVAGGAFINPFEGPFYLPQYNNTLRRSDDFGKVYYKRSQANDKLIIYYQNVQFEPRRYDLGTGNVR